MTMMLGRLLLVCAIAFAMLGVAFAQDGSCPEPNDDLASACPLAPGTTIHATIERPGDRDVFKIVADTPGRFQIDLTDLPADYDLYALDSGEGILGQSVHEGTSPEQLVFTVTAGTYFIVVQVDPQRDFDASRPYTLRAAFTPAAGVGAPATVPAPTSEHILNEDNFDDPSVGFMPLSTPASDLQIGHIDGEYFVRNMSPTIRARGPVLPGIFGDATLSLDVRIVGESSGRWVNLRCREHILNPSPFTAQAYSLNITPDTREFELRRQDGPTSIVLATRRGEPAIRTGGDSNHIELGCVGTKITVRANGVEIAAVDDSTYAQGTFVITAGGPDGAMPRSELRLDNLVIRGP